MKRKRSFQRREKKLQDCIEKDSNNPELYLELGKLYFLNSDYDRAAETYGRGLKLESDSIPLLFNLGVTREARNQIEQAKELYLRILSLDANNQQAQERLDKITSF